MPNVRTRFAPSPTGFLHVGGIRTALFSWLLARQNNGQFILRFEDTDQKREVANAKEHLIKSLISLGLNYDEGPDKGGPYSPYIQSERLNSYVKWATKLIEAGRAYADPYSASEVQAFRDEARANKQPFLYRNHRPYQEAKWDGNQPLRFKSDPKSYTWHDEVMGDMKSGPEVIDDFILIKADGFPTYNFAHIIDDHEMKITHVLRGQEFLSSMPNYLNLYEALGIDRPFFVTLPHVLGPSGQKKLSKRDGDSQDVLDYISDGYLPEALISFIATLGWNDGSTQEIFTRDELITKFSLSRIQKSGARFDELRLNWINGILIRQMSLEDLYNLCTDFWPSEASQYDEGYKKAVLSLVKDRIKYLKELPDLTKYFFIDLSLDPELIKNHKQLSKMASTELKNLLIATRDSLNNSDFTEPDLSQKLNDLLLSVNQKPVILFSLIRIATTQAPFSPGLSETLAVLGKERSLKRLDEQINSL